MLTHTHTHQTEERLCTLVHKQPRGNLGMFSSHRRLWSSTFHIPLLAHHISPLSWTNISVCLSLDQPRPPVGLSEFACDAMSCILRPFKPTQTGELCVVVFHWMLSAEILCAGVYIHPRVPGLVWGGQARLDWRQHFALGSIVSLCEPQGGERTVIESKTKSERSHAAYVSVENLYIGVKGGVDNHCIYYWMGLSKTGFQSKIYVRCRVWNKIVKRCNFSAIPTFRRCTI